MENINKENVEAEPQDNADCDKQWQSNSRARGSSCPSSSSGKKLLELVDDEDEADEEIEEDANNNDNDSNEDKDLRARDNKEEMVLKFRRVAEDAYSKHNVIRNTISAPIIIAMKGNPFTGRKLIAFFVASILRCPLIKQSDFDNYKEKSKENQETLWKRICTLALSQLTSGRSVVIDTELDNQNEFDQLKELSEITRTPLGIFECRLKFNDSVWDKLDGYEEQLNESDPVKFILDEFMEKPTSQYINSRNLDIGEIPIILLKEYRSFDMLASIALTDLRSHINHSFDYPKENSCAHIFRLINIEDENKIPCYQCKQLVLGSVYRCHKCRITFHPTCSYFPESLTESEYSLNAKLTLQHVDEELDADASCNCCKQLIRSSTSSRYYSTEDRNLLFDLECLFLLPAKLTSRLHEHELVRRRSWSPSLCYECHTNIGVNSFYYECGQCHFPQPTFDVFCLWLPEIVQSDHHRHPFTLSILPRDDSDPYFCHGCEKERDTDKWIYYCEDCDFQSHPRCILNAHCLPRSFSKEISITNKKSNNKLTDQEFNSCSSHLSSEKVMAIIAKFKDPTKEIKLPIIITTKGHSTGRKLVARILATAFDCLLIVEDSLCEVPHTANEPKQVYYREFSQIALSQLQIGLSIVIDCDLSHESEFFVLRDFALATDTPLFIVEFRPCNEDKMQDPHSIVWSDYEYDAGDTPKITVNLTPRTSDDIDKLMPHILRSISAYCEESSKEAKEPVIPSCYRHTFPSEIQGDICSIYSEQISYLKCEDCGFVLKKACTKLPLRIEIWNLPFILEKYGDNHDKVRCDCCNELIEDYAYLSSGEDYFICVDVNCLFTPWIPAINRHEHQLVLAVDSDNFQCGACGSNRKHTLCYACPLEDCDFQIGVKCGFLKETETFDRHCHPFQLIVSPEHVSDQYYCEACESERDKKHWVYCCVPCDYFIHVRCIVPTGCCPPDW